MSRYSINYGCSVLAKPLTCKGLPLLSLQESLHILQELPDDFCTPLTSGPRPSDKQEHHPHDNHADNRVDHADDHEKGPVLFRHVRRPEKAPHVLELRAHQHKRRKEDRDMLRIQVA